MPENFGQFLTFIGTSGAIGAVLSFLAENWNWFQSRTGQTKTIILFVVSFLMGLASLLLVRYVPEGVIAEAEPYYKVFVSTVAILLSSQAYHSLAHSNDGTTTLDVSLKQSASTASTDANSGPNSAQKSTPVTVGPANITISTSASTPVSTSTATGYVPAVGDEADKG